MLSLAEMERAEGRWRGRAAAGAFGQRLRLAASVFLFFFLATLVNLGVRLAVRCGMWRGGAAEWQGRVGKLCRVWRWMAERAGVLQVEVRRGHVFGGLSGVVVAANHPSLLDAFVLLGLVPRAVCVMRSDLRRHPALGTLAALAGYLPNARGAAMVRAARERLEAGMNLLVFPEGTRSEGTVPGPFKPGFALAAAMAGAPVLPVGIRYSDGAFRKGSGLLASAALPGKMEVVPGGLLRPLPGEDARAFARRVRAECGRLAG